MTALTLRESYRLARHPVIWLIPVIVLTASALDGATNGRGPAYWYDTIFIALTFFGPIFTLFAANLVAGSARRSRAEEMLQATPASDPARTWAMALGIALPLLAAGLIGVGAMALLDTGYDLPPDVALSPGELAQLPLILPGAGLLGLLAARRLPFTGGVLIMFVAATIGALVLFRRFDAGLWWMWWTTAQPPEGTAPPPGRPWLHAAYLAGLCTCAAVAAVHRDRRRLLLTGAPILAATLIVGWLQLR
ncbi:hypothetical protein [Dactylosporangium sp. NPDC051541]|uniref:hypothetical protein n=1 Tax=Dactylosporangium sp. NPDC051541 TaxID=3363977 RepID=UPI003796F3FB